MSEVVVKNLPILDILTRSNSVSRQKILKKADFALIKAIVECVLNVLNGNIHIESGRMKKLKKYKNTLRKLSAPGKNWSLKKKVIVQSGGSFLPLLLTPIVTSLIDLIRK